MGSFRRPRPRFMSSPVLTDLARFHASSPTMQLSNASVWNSVQSAVIKVFEGGGLQANELYTLNESIRWLLKTEMGSFISDYLQNQLLTKGLAHVREKIAFYEGDSQLLILSEMWVRFFTEILPTLQAIFYPVQGQDLTVRQMALVGFRDLVLLKLPLEAALSIADNLPPAIPQMLLVLQGVHEPSGPNLEYTRLERLVEIVISPYLGNVLPHGHPGCYRAHPSASRTCEGPVRGHPSITITHHPSSDSSSLEPLVELEGEAYLEKTGGVRRHTVANAHSDIQLLSACGRMHAGTEGEEPRGGGGGRPARSFSQRRIPKSSTRGLDQDPRQQSPPLPS